MKKGIVTGLILFLLLAACQPKKPATDAGIRLAVIPVLDTLPMYVAQEEGLFEKQGVHVEFIPVASAPERDQLIAAGQADGMVNEALSTAFFNKEKVQTQVIRFARAATAENHLFSILASKDSAIQSVSDLDGIPIGVSQGTVIEYLTDRLLQAEGFSAGQIQTIAVPKIDDRMNMLNSGALQAGMLPEPATTLAVINGSRLILDDTRHPEYSYSTITFRKAIIDANPQAVRAFLAAIEEAVRRINSTPEKYEDLLVKYKVVPPALQGKFKVPKFISAGVPSEAQWNDMIGWAVEKGLLQKPVPYAESVTAVFLPR